MKRILSSWAAAGVAALLASGASAQMNTGNARTGSAAGAESFETVVSVDRGTSQIVVQDANGQRRTLVLNNATSISRQGRTVGATTAMRIGDIAAGDRILATGASQRGVFTAQRIQVIGTGGVSAPPPGGVDATPPDPSVPDVQDPEQRPGAVGPGGAGPTPGNSPGKSPVPGAPSGGGAGRM